MESRICPLFSLCFNLVSHFAAKHQFLATDLLLNPPTARRKLHSSNILRDLPHVPDEIASSVELKIYFYVGTISILMPRSPTVGGVFLSPRRLISCPFFSGILGIIPKSNSLTFNKWWRAKNKASSPTLDLPRAIAFQGQQKAA